jgi:hypothetical protein
MTILLFILTSISKEDKKTIFDLLLLSNFWASAKNNRLLRMMKYESSDWREGVTDCKLSIFNSFSNILFYTIVDTISNYDTIAEIANWIDCVLVIACNREKMKNIFT